MGIGIVDWASAIIMLPPGRRRAKKPMKLSSPGTRTKPNLINIIVWADIFTQSKLFDHAEDQTTAFFHPPLVNNHSVNNPTDVSEKNTPQKTPDSCQLKWMARR